MHFFTFLSFSSKIAQIGIQNDFFGTFLKPKGGTLENFQILKTGRYMPILSTSRSKEKNEI